MTDTEKLYEFAKYIDELNQIWQPHEAQVEIGSPLLRGESKDIFAQCARNFGKTEAVCYLLWRWAQTNPNSENYYFAPEQKQAKEIVWASRRLPTFGPDSWIESRNETEMRIRFKNGSFIKVDGSDNVDSYRGVKPKGLTVFDEFKDFRREFYDAYEPNRAAYKSPLIIIGTPPGTEGLFTEVAAEYQSNPAKRFYKFSTYSNPFIDTSWLADKKKEYEKKGELDVWEREYKANFVRGGAGKLFPMLNTDHVYSHDSLMQKIFRDRRKLEWYAWCDPAAASCFAVLFIAVNKFTREIFCLDEVYEMNQTYMRVRAIWPRIKSIMNDLCPEIYGNWRQGYDEAETWFQNEVLNEFNESLEPTQKMKSDKTTGLSLIKDILAENKVFISDRCVKLFWELDQAKKDDHGRVVKKNDHLIDCFRYILAASHYDLKPIEEEIIPKDMHRRGYSIEEDFKSTHSEWEKFD